MATRLYREYKFKFYLNANHYIIINGKKYDAITEGEFINKGVKIKVILVEGNKIVIKEAK